MYTKIEETSKLLLKGSENQKTLINVRNNTIYERKIEFEI